MFCPICNFNNRDSAKYCISCGTTFNEEDGGSLAEFLDGEETENFIDDTNKIIADRYEIIKTIACGGMGRVYLARDLKRNYRLVLKKMFNIASTDEEMEYLEKRFKEEAVLLHKLKHSCLPRVSDFFVFDNHFYMAMEYIEGDNLLQFIKKKTGSRISIKDAVTMMLKTLDLLIFLHNQDPAVIHRDIKPSNIMIKPDGNIGLVDFGLARSLELEQGATARVGTYGFASPEHYTGKFCLASDLYGLGATFHYLISGENPRKRPPFEYPPLKKYRNDIPRGLQGFFNRLLAPDPKNRFNRAEDAKDFLTKLHETYTQNTSVKQKTVPAQTAPMPPPSPRKRLFKPAVKSGDSAVQKVVRQKDSIKPEVTAAKDSQIKVVQNQKPSAPAQRTDTLPTEKPISVSVPAAVNGSDLSHSNNKNDTPRNSAVHKADAAAQKTSPSGPAKARSSSHPQEKANNAESHKKSERYAKRRRKVEILTDSNNHAEQTSEKKAVKDTAGSEAQEIHPKSVKTSTASTKAKHPSKAVSFGIRALARWIRSLTLRIRWDNFLLLIGSIILLIIAIILVIVTFRSTKQLQDNIPLKPTMNTRININSADNNRAACRQLNANHLSNKKLYSISSQACSKTNNIKMLHLYKYMDCNHYKLKNRLSLLI